MKHVHPPEPKPIAKPDSQTRANLILLIAIGFVGCLVAISLTLRFPELGMTAEQFNAFAGP